MVKKLFIFFFSLCSLYPIAHGQDMLQKLQSEYQGSKLQDPERFYRSGRYAQALFFNQQEDMAFHILKQEVQRASTLSESKYAAYLNTVLAINKMIAEEPAVAKQYITKARNLANRTSDLEIKGYVAYGHGWLLARQQQEGEAVKSLLEALGHLDKAPKSKTLGGRKSAVYKELTAIYANWNEFALQEKYSKLSLDLAREQQDPMAIFDGYMLLGYLYEQQYLTQTTELSYRNSAETYYLKALDTYLQNEGEMPIPSNLSFVANNLAHLYFKHFPRTYREKAISFAELARQKGEETKQYNLVASSYGIMAEMELQDGNAAKAKEYLLASLIAMNKSTVQDQQILMSIYESLAKASEEEGDYKEAIQYYKRYVETFSAFYDQEKLNLSKRLEAQYEKGKQEQQMATLTLESEKKEQQIRLMEALGLQQRQELENMTLIRANQSKELELSKLHTERQAQEIQLNKLEAKNKEQQIDLFQKELNLKDKLNTYYIALLLAFLLLLGLVLYAYRQRSKHLRQQIDLKNLELAQERQDAKIATLTALLDGQEQERARIARDLHDGLGGLLSGTKLHLSQLNEQLLQQNKMKMEKGITQLDMAVDELRRVAHNLTPDLLQKFGLLEALQEYARRMSNETLEIDVQFLYFRTPLPAESELLLYRIIQELVNNAIKHANPTQVIIQLVEEDNAYLVTVEDDGTGFDYLRQQGNSAGLLNIQSRVEFLKGVLHVQSDPGKGSSFEITFPKSTTI